WVVSTCARSLSRAGFSVGRIDAGGVSAEALRGRPCVFLPIAERIRPETVDALCEYVDDGGFVFAFYNAPENLLRKLGFERGHYVRCEDAGFDVAEMRFDDGVLNEAAARGFELPSKIEQHSWALMTAEPLAGWESGRTSPIFGDKRARKLAVWFDKNGKSVAQPAILASPNGFFCSHIFLDEGATAQATLVEAFVSAFDANLERRRAWQNWRSIFEIGLEPEDDVLAKRRETLDALEKALAKRGWTLADVARLIGGEEFDDFVGEDAGNAREAQNAETAQSRADLAALRADVDAIRAEFVDAYCRSLPSRAGEGRFWWEHSGFGIERGDWEKTAQALADAGFNGVIPNMLGGGVAYYRSEILPVAPSVEEYGDQIAAAVAACKKRGIETHIWKVCFNASNAPAEFLAEMRAQGRLQVSLDGEESPWLCPSHPANLELERAALEEVATKYDVDGIHLDYIRYPDDNHCFCDGCKARFSAEYERKTGRKLDNFPTCVRENKEIRAAFDEWRRSHITSLVRSVRKTLDEKRPNVALSAAVFSGVDSAKRSVAQDWIGWIDEGLLDFVCPMDYTSDAAGFAATVRGQLDAVAGRTPVYPGIGMTATGISMAAEQVAAQVVEARKAGADGFTIFNLDPRTAKVALPALKKGATAEPTERLKVGLGESGKRAKK
ncbi:MAG: family 10 glycosylhydrolase, partial [Thermoguttaceae bacterium]|nr:family 10 glycosylhydrolase [Thermoguttaceae bacterium]